MARSGLEVAEIFRDHGPSWRRANAGHVSLAQLKTMAAIENCRTAVLGGHVAACAHCGRSHIAYNSCKNRHCPKCQGPAARDWMAAQAADLLPVEYFHVVFTLPAAIAEIACRKGFFLPVKVLSRLFRRLFLSGPAALHRAGKLQFFGTRTGLLDDAVFAAHLAPLRKTEWVVYAKPPFGGPEAALAYLSRYTHRVAISNSRLISADAETVTFRWKDNRMPNRDRQKVMRLSTDEFIRRFLLHVLPNGFHRICHYGLFASSTRRSSIATIRSLLEARPPDDIDNPRGDADDSVEAKLRLRQPCPSCGGVMHIIEMLRPGELPRSRGPPWQVTA